MWLAILLIVIRRHLDVVGCRRKRDGETCGETAATETKGQAGCDDEVAESEISV
jgi:hypothetical protein